MDLKQQPLAPRAAVQPELQLGLIGLAPVLAIHPRDKAGGHIAVMFGGRFHRPAPMPRSA